MAGAGADPVNTAPIRAAVIDRDADGTPRSREHDDIYHPRAGALAQARHVFLDGDALAARWRGRERFVILETGFGLGNNFLAAWAAWRADPERCRQLHFISIEATPPTHADLVSAARDPVLEPLATELASAWPPHTWNLHRLSFDDGAVDLLLAFGDVAAWLPQLVASVDALFLDGFAPARNPSMWDARLFKAMARLAVPGASVATWTAARAVREGLRSAGFEVGVAAGSGGKRDIIRASFAPCFTPRIGPRRTHAIEPQETTADHDEPIVIIGAGLAGCALARALAESGRPTLLLERGDEIAGEGSGNAAGIFHGVVHGSDGRHARFQRAAAFEARQAVEQAIGRHGVKGGVGGLLRLEPGAAGAEALQAVIDRLGLPDDYVRALSSEAASRLAGLALSTPAWHYPQGGWVDPRGLAQAWLAAAAEKVEWRLQCSIASLRRVDGRWALLDASGATIARASIVVLCNAGGAFELIGSTPWPVRRQRGQLSSLEVSDLPPGVVPCLPITGAGYVLPAIDGRLWFGATSHWDDDGLAISAVDQRENLDRLARLIGVSNVPSVEQATGRAASRWVCDDRLPIIGAVPASACDAVAAEGLASPSARLDQPRFVARAPGLFVCSALGSRGIASAALGARILAAAITGAPSPVEADLLDAVDPARFVSRAFRRAEAARQHPYPDGAQPAAAGSLGAA